MSTLKGMEARINRKIRMGMVGGGPGAFIGEIHRKAARLDGFADIVAGAFDINPAKSQQMGRDLFLDPRRVYNNYHEMIEKELKLDPSERIDFVAVTAPNNWHFPIVRDFLNSGFNVMCEKPLAMSVKESLEIERLVKKSKKLFGIMHNYTGYPMVKLARDMVRQGELGKILKIVVQYPQGWLIRLIERTGQQQAAWRTDPKQCGISGCMGDIGSHAENVSEYITGLKMTEVCADLTTFVKGRMLEDDGNCLVRYNNGAKGLLFASQISIGDENNLAIWVYGENKALEWHQEDPNYLHVRVINGPVQTWRRGNDYVAEKSPAAKRGTRLPFGHPEAFIEAFANVYRNYLETLAARIEGAKPDPLALDFPKVEDGIRGMRFIEAVVKSSKMGAKWVQI